MKSRILPIMALGVLGAVGLSGCQLMDKLKARDHLNQGVQSYTQKNYDQAVGEFQSAIELDPTLTDAYLYLATTYRSQFVPGVPSPDNLRKGQEAIATFERVMQLDPDNVEGKALNAAANIADLYRNMSEPDKAKEWYRKAMAMQEDKSQALYGIATIDYNLVDEKTGKDGENVPELTEEEIAQLNRTVDEGIESLRQALEINKRYSEAMEYLNLMYREKAELASSEEEKERWQDEADRLALEALNMKRQLQAEAEAKRRQVFSSSETSTQ